MLLYLGNLSHSCDLLQLVPIRFCLSVVISDISKRQQLNIFYFLKTTWPILFKSGVKHLWVLENFSFKFQESCTQGTLGLLTKLPNFDQFSKVFFFTSESAHVEEKLKAKLNRPGSPLSKLQIYDPLGRGS